MRQQCSFELSKSNLKALDSDEFFAATDSMLATANPKRNVVTCTIPTAFCKYFQILVSDHHASIAELEVARVIIGSKDVAKRIEQPHLISEERTANTT
jgi:hypothetical protein